MSKNRLVCKMLLHWLIWELQAPSIEFLKLFIILIILSFCELLWGGRVDIISSRSCLCQCARSGFDNSSLLWLKVLLSWKISLQGIKVVGFFCARVYRARSVRCCIFVN